MPMAAPAAHPRPAPRPVFTRAAPAVRWNPRAQPGRAPTLDFREWQVRCLLSSLPPEVSAVLYEWLLPPARPHWLRGLAPLALTGMTSNRLLCTHGTRLRQFAEACAQIAGAGPAEAVFAYALARVMA